MKKTGELLKQKRETANLSLSEVALATKINPKVLIAIENGDEARLPAKTFLKGFVRSYAVFLKLDVEEVMRLFMEETGGQPVERTHEAYQKSETPAAPGPRRRVADESSSGLRTLAVVVIVVLIGLIIGVRELIEKYQREKVVASEVKVTPLATPPIVPQPAPPAPAQDDKKPAEEKKPDAVVAEPAPPAPPPTQGIPAALEAPKPMAPVVKPVETAKPTEAAKPTETVKPTEAVKPTEPAKAAEPAVATDAPKADAVKTDAAKTEATKTEAKPTEEAKPASAAKIARTEIILEALDNVEVKFQVHGEARHVTLGPTQVHTIRADEPVVLDLSDGGAVNLIVNGHERGPPGELGKAKQVTLP